MAKFTFTLEGGFGDKVPKSINNTRKAVNKLTKDGTKGAKKLSAEFSVFGDVLKGALAADAIKAGARALVGAITSLTTDFAAAGDTIAKTSDKLGVGVEALQELRFAAERSGVGAQTFDIALQRLTRRTAEAARGTGVAKDSFEKLGIELRDNQGNIRATEDIFKDLAGAFQGVENSADRVSLAFSFFDTEGVALVNVLNQGEEGLKAFGERARELGFIISKDTARAAEKFVDAQLDLNKALEGVRKEIAEELLPAGTDFLTLMTNLAIVTKQFLAQFKAAEVGAFDSFAASIKSVGAGILGLIPQLSIAKNILGIVGETAKRAARDVKTAAQEISEIDFVGPESPAQRATRETKELLQALQDRTTERRSLGLEQDEVDAEIADDKFLLLIEKELEQSAELRESLREAQMDGDRDEQAELLAQIKAKDSIEKEANKKAFEARVKANIAFLEEEKKFGTAITSINKVLNDDRVQGFKSASGQLRALTQSSNSTLKAIGKGAAVANIAISSAEGAVAAFKSLAGIPIIGPVLGAAAAGALIAFGVEQTANVLKAQAGGIVPGVGGIPGGLTDRDTQTALLSPGEFIVPRQNFDEVINALTTQRAQETEAEQEEQEVGQQITIGFDGEEASQVLTARQIEDSSLGISREAS